MLLSISLILILGMFIGWICRKMKLPASFELLGMILLAPKLMRSTCSSFTGCCCSQNGEAYG